MTRQRSKALEKQAEPPAPRAVPEVVGEGGHFTLCPSSLEDLAALFGVDSSETAVGLSDLLLNVCGRNDRRPDAARFKTALGLVAEMRPNGGAEAMLAIQAVAAQSLGIQLASVGMQPGGSNRNGFSQTALNAFRTSARLMSDLEKRKRGPVPTQRVVVERVSVGEGGQAIVGAVAEGGPGGTGDGR